MIEAHRFDGFQALILTATARDRHGRTAPRIDWSGSGILETGEFDTCGFEFWKFGPSNELIENLPRFADFSGLRQGEAQSIASSLESSVCLESNTVVLDRDFVFAATMMDPTKGQNSPGSVRAPDRSFGEFESTIEIFSVGCEHPGEIVGGHRVVWAARQSLL
jgi:hypothetical protein